MLHLLRGGRLVLHVQQTPGQQLGEGIEGGMLIVGRSLAFQPRMALAGDVLFEHLDQPRFANAGLAPQDHDLPHTLGDARPTGHQESHFLRAPHQGCQAVGSGHLQATLGRTGAQDAIHLEGLRQAGERVRTQRLTPEIASDELMRRGGDHQRVGRCQVLQPCRNIGRLPQGQRLVACPCTDVAHHHQAGMDPQPHRHLLSRRQRRVGQQRGEGVQQAQPRPDRSLGVVFMRHRIAKIAQHAIAEVLRHIAVKALQHLGTDLVVGAHHLAVIFRVQTSGERRRADQVAEQHGEVAAFGLGWRQGGGERHHLVMVGRVRRLQRRRTSRAWDCLSVLHDRRYKAIAPPLYRGNVPGGLHRVPQRPAQLANGDTHHGIAHRRLGPDGVEQGVFRDQAVRVGHQVMQHLEGFGRQGNGLCPTPETGVVRIKAKVGEAPLGGSHRQTSLGLAIGQPQHHGLT